MAEHAKAVAKATVADRAEPGSAATTCHDLLEKRPQVRALASADRMLNARPTLAAQRAAAETLSRRPPTGPRPIQRETSLPSPNRTGMPDELRPGIESASGVSMDDVRIHRNSAEPERLGALAYAEGNDIHLGPGQDRHLPHEAWHVVQQKQGRVRPTRQLKDSAINADPALERDAELMGARAQGASPSDHDMAVRDRLTPAPVIQRIVRSKTGDEVGLGGTPQAVSNLLSSDKVYLIQSHDDFEQLCNSDPDGIQIVTPKRHIIGEDHTQSRFEEYEERWGWGAGLIHEVNTKHPTTGIRRDGAVKPLEDTIVKHVAVLMHSIEIVQSSAHLIRQISDQLEPEMPPAADVNGQLKFAAEQTIPEVAYAIEVGTDLAKFELPEDEADDAAAATNELVGRLADLTAAQNDLRSRPDNAPLTSLEVAKFVTAIAAGKIWTQMDELLGCCKKIARQESAELNLYPTDNVILEGGFAAFNPLREHHMGINIKAHGDLPLLVAVGAAHLKGLKGQGISDAEFHDDYTGFVEATKASVVLPDLRGGCCVIQ